MVRTALVFIFLVLICLGCKKNTPSESPVILVPSTSIGDIQVFPIDNPWNTDISKEIIDPNSDNLIAGIGNAVKVHPDFGTIWDGSPIGIPYNVVSGTQTRVVIHFDNTEESDAGPYPVPSNALKEAGSDSHVIVLDKDNLVLYELYAAQKNSDNSWNAASGAKYDLTSNALRNDFYTSADAAGLPIFPGLVRYEEVVEKGVINHALRFTVQHTRNAFVHPATHAASSLTDANLPPMGMRVRLKAGFNISSFSLHNQVILKALKKYGMFVADNGSNWFISGAPDTRWDDEELNQLKTIEGSNFEVVKMGSVLMERFK